MFPALAGRSARVNMASKESRNPPPSALSRWTRALTQVAQTLPTRAIRATTRSQSRNQANQTPPPPMNPDMTPEALNSIDPAPEDDMAPSAPPQPPLTPEVNQLTRRAEQRRQYKDETTPEASRASSVSTQGRLSKEDARTRRDHRRPRA